MKEKGLVLPGGAGGFLNPPGHPEHDFHVETDLRSRPENRGHSSLSYAVECEWLDDATREAAKLKLDSWVPLPLSDESVRDWIAQVLGYFVNCYKGEGQEPGCWHASNLKIQPGSVDLNDHAGVHLIQQYYPDYAPNRDDFERAYWGKKPETQAA